MLSPILSAERASLYETQLDAREIHIHRHRSCRSRASAHLIVSADGNISYVANSHGACRSRNRGFMSSLASFLIRTIERTSCLSQIVIPVYELALLCVIMVVIQYARRCLTSTQCAPTVGGWPSCSECFLRAHKDSLLIPVSINQQQSCKIQKTLCNKTQGRARALITVCRSILDWWSDFRYIGEMGFGELAWAVRTWQVTVSSLLCRAFGNCFAPLMLKQTRTQSD
jgi:hypothetical protein